MTVQQDDRGQFGGLVLLGLGVIPFCGPLFPHVHRWCSLGHPDGCDHHALYTPLARPILKLKLCPDDTPLDSNHGWTDPGST
jgi:hypothetical protein